MPTGLPLVSGGVRKSPHLFLGVALTAFLRPTVIFQQPRPGPPLPKKESYLTIGWKQVRDTYLKDLQLTMP